MYIYTSTHIHKHTHTHTHTHVYTTHTHAHIIPLYTTLRRHRKAAAPPFLWAAVAVYREAVVKSILRISYGEPIQYRENTYREYI